MVERERQPIQTHRRRGMRENFRFPCAAIFVLRCNYSMSELIFVFYSVSPHGIDCTPRHFRTAFLIFLHCGLKMSHHW